MPLEIEFKKLPYSSVHNFKVKLVLKMWTVGATNENLSNIRCDTPLSKIKGWRQHFKPNIRKPKYFRIFLMKIKNFNNDW